MTADRYTPQVGDRVRLANWPDRRYLDVTHIGRCLVVGDDEDGDEICCYEIAGSWVKVETPAPLPERWVNVYLYDIVNGSSIPHRTREGAASSATPGRIAVVHVWTDANGVDHADIERVES